MPYGHLIAATVMTFGVCQGHLSIASFLPRDSYAKRGICRRRVSVVCVSVTLRYCIKTAKRKICLLYTSPSPRDRQKSRMPSSA